MRTIFKQTLDTVYEQTIELPEYSRILCINVQHGIPCIWYECNPNMPEEEVKIFCVGTGGELPERVGLEYLGTVLMFGGDCVFHYYKERSTTHG
jgi:hypothetical protein